MFPAGIKLLHPRASWLRCRLCTSEHAINSSCDVRAVLWNCAFAECRILELSVCRLTLVIRYRSSRGISRDGDDINISRDSPALELEDISLHVLVHLESLPTLRGPSGIRYLIAVHDDGDREHSRFIFHLHKHHNPLRNGSSISNSEDGLVQ